MNYEYSKFVRISTINEITQTINEYGQMIRSGDFVPIDEEVNQPNLIKLQVIKIV